MPQVVFSALFGAGESGNNDKQLEKPMSESKVKVAATVKQIRSAFPKAKSETIIRCMEKEMDMEEVATAMTDEVLQENETLSAKVKALEEEVMALRAKAEEHEMPVAQEDEEKVVAKAKAKRGVQPVAKAGGFSGACPREKWDNAVSAYVAKGYTKIRAVQAVNRDNPGLRESLVEQANA
jgi:TolA-binding protein